MLNILLFLHLIGRKENGVDVPLANDNILNTHNTRLKVITFFLLNSTEPEIDHAHKY